MTQRSEVDKKNKCNGDLDIFGKREVNYDIRKQTIRRFGILNKVNRGK